MTEAIDPEAARRVKLLATDLDGTLLVDHHVMSPRVLAAVAAAQDAGIEVAVATGRQVRHLPPSIAHGPLRYAVATNGAVATRLDTGEVLFAEHIPTPVLRRLVSFIKERFPQVAFAAFQRGGEHWVAEAGYRQLVAEEDFYKDSPQYHVGPLEQLWAEPAVKLAARHPDVDPEDMLAALNGSGLSGFHATTSGAPFIEIGPADVTKATGVGRLAGILGLSRDEVAGAGDAKNDIELIRWAGVGVAMGNSLPEVMDAADVVTADVAEDGIAVFLEALLAARR
ncbi:MAG: Cof-type HAD-IIB family hydrolase [Propionibacteriaceae bacterium]|nr:Cof-type HAD-IIB family hydrolase [Propionibacteriaceae bacterium]